VRLDRREKLLAEARAVQRGVGVRRPLHTSSTRGRRS